MSAGHQTQLVELMRSLCESADNNARVMNEIYESVTILRKAVAIVQTLLEEQLENPEEQLQDVGLRHAEWNGASPHPYGCDGGEGIDEKKKTDDNPETTIPLCPFCAKYRGILIDDHKFHVECPNCGASGPYSNTKYYAVYLWSVVSDLHFKEK